MPCAVPEKTNSVPLPVFLKQGVEYPARKVFLSIFHRVFPVLRLRAIRKLSPGTIDADYRGEIGVILVNLSDEEFVIEDGERVAQMIIAKHEQADWEEVVELVETERGAGGFGSTGVK